MSEVGSQGRSVKRKRARYLSGVVSGCAVLVFSLFGGCYLADFEEDHSAVERARSIRDATVIWAFISQPLIAPVQFLNQAAGAEKYILFPDSACAQVPLRVFPAVSVGQRTAATIASSFYLNIDSTNCIATFFSLNAFTSGTAPRTVTCTVSSTNVTCDNPAQSTVAR